MKTLVIGASLKSDRFSNRAVRLLRHYNHEVVAIGIQSGNIGDVEIQTGMPALTDIHTVTMYVSANNQHDFIDYIIALNPKRIIFNPGTENPDFYRMLKENNILFLENCTLVMLNTGTF